MKTWEQVRKEKEEIILQTRKEKVSSTPTPTSTHAMDTEEAQEVNKEIAERAAERKLKK